MSPRRAGASAGDDDPRVQHRNRQARSTTGWTPEADVEEEGIREPWQD
jgi:hypothetical protein